MITPFTILVFVIVLGVLIFVHELGHFVAAKACGIYVDRFSLGMPPRLFGFKIGETDYCVGLLPIGGYVKMAGQEDAPLSEEERDQAYGNIPEDRWFNKKTVWQRAIVLFAGPFMNLVLAFGIYAFMAGWGYDVPAFQVETRIGAIEEGSPASKARMYLVNNGEQPDLSSEPDAIGWDTGDRILSIDGEQTDDFEDLAIAAILGKNQTAIVELERLAVDGSRQRYLSPVEPKVLDKRIGAAQFGLTPFRAALVDHILPGSPAEEQGIQKGDIILRANGDIVDRNTFTAMVRAVPPGSRIDLLIERSGELIELTLSTRRDGSFDGISFEPPLTPLLSVTDSSTLKFKHSAGQAGSETVLRRGDEIVSVNGQRDAHLTLRRLARQDLSTIVELEVRPGGGLLGAAEDQTLRKTSVSLIAVIQALFGVDMEANPAIASIRDEVAESTGLQRKDVILEVDGKPATAARLATIEQTRIGDLIPVKVERPRLAWGLAQDRKVFDAEIPITPVQQIGVVWGTETVTRRVPLAQAVPFAFEESVRQVRRIGDVLYSLFAGNLSPKMLGGPVMIGDVVTMAARSGFFDVLNITALISLNLAIFNLLPLPVLDGGQLMFLAVEAIRRRPVSVRVMEMVQQAGILAIIGLLVYVTFNDVSRIVDRWLP